MGRMELRKRIDEGLFLLDGAMGTQLMARGVAAGKCNDYLNIEAADIILDIHRRYFEAGSDAVITNTFGSNRIALKRHGLDKDVAKINFAGAEIARKAAGDGKYVLGDIGPSGDFLQPLGNLMADELKEAFAEQAKGLGEGGVDGFIIETMTAVDEVKVAVEAVKSVSGLPIFVSLSYDKAGEGFRTMMGVSVAEAVKQVMPLGVDAMGFNCGTLGMEEYVELAKVYAAQIGSKAVLLAEPNAGKPELVDGRAVYKLSGEEFAETSEEIYAAGAVILGGCCGTGPEHIRAMAKKLRK